jgi:NADH dehydrogenase
MATAGVATVFGGSGFIGRAVVQRLAKAGYVVRVPTRDVVSAGRLRTAGAVGQVVPMFCPLRSEDAIGKAVAGADVVINLIGILFENRRNRFSRVQGETPGLIAKAAATAGVKKLVHISAIGASSESRAQYARSKAQGEAGVRTAFPGATILRPSIVFGPEDNFFNQFAGLAKISPFLPLIGGGHTKFQPVYVADVADAVMASLTRADADGQTYELGGPDVCTFRELMQKTLEWSGQKRCLLGIPYPIAKLQATLLQLLPNPLLTRDQVEMLKADNVVGSSARTLADLGIDATGMSAVVPSYLSRFKPGGAFAKAS